MEYQITTQDRRAFVKTMVDLTGAAPKYLGMPSRAYQIGPYQVSNDMKLSFMADESGILPILRNRGMIEGSGEAFSEEPAEEETIVSAPVLRSSESQEVEKKRSPGKPMAVKLPLDRHNGMTIRKLIFYIYSYEEVLNIATKGSFHVDERFIPFLQGGVRNLSIENLLCLRKQFEEKYQTPPYTGFEISNNTIIYNGFGSARKPEQVWAYETLAARIDDHCIRAKRIRPCKAKIAESEKYMVRMMLVGLGMDEEVYRPVRQTLMEGLTGVASFRSNSDYQKYLDHVNEYNRLNRPQVSMEEQRAHFEAAMERRRRARLEAM